jgi:Xaa-Pro aminopeptidase
MIRRKEKIMNNPTYADFPQEEFELRWNRAQQLIRDHELDALMVTEEINFSYFTGYRPNGLGSFYSKTRPLLLLLPAHGKPVVMVNEFMKGDAAKRSWVPDIRSWLKVPFSASYVASLLKEQGLAESKIGAELGLEQRIEMPIQEFEQLKNQCPKTKFVDASDIIWKVRMQKSELEIKKMEVASNATSKAYDRCFQDIHEGMTEKEVARVFSRYMIEEGADKPGFVIVNSGPGESDRVCGTATDRRLTKGDTLWIDGGSVYDGYWSDFSREGTVGAPSPKQQQLHNLICDITNQCVEAVKPNSVVSDIMSVCNRALQKAGMEPWRVGRIGHGLGMMITEQPSVSSDDKTVLEPGYVITIEPGLMTEVGMFCVEENVLVTNTGHRVLTSASRELHRI